MKLAPPDCLHTNFSPVFLNVFGNKRCPGIDPMQIFFFCKTDFNCNFMIGDQTSKQIQILKKKKYRKERRFFRETSEGIVSKVLFIRSICVAVSLKKWPKQQTNPKGNETNWEWNTKRETNRYSSWDIFQSVEVHIITKWPFHTLGAQAQAHHQLFEVFWKASWRRIQKRRLYAPCPGPYSLQKVQQAPT